MASSAGCRKAAVVRDEAQPAITMITTDHETSSVVLTRSDGKEARFPLGNSPFADASALSRLHYTPSFDGLLASRAQALSDLSPWRGQLLANGADPPQEGNAFPPAAFVLDPSDGSLVTRLSATGEGEHNVAAAYPKETQAIGDSDGSLWFLTRDLQAVHRTDACGVTSRVPDFDQHLPPGVDGDVVAANGHLFVLLGNRPLRVHEVFADGTTRPVQWQ